MGVLSFEDIIGIWVGNDDLRVSSVCLGIEMDTSKSVFFANGNMWVSVSLLASFSDVNYFAVAAEIKYIIVMLSFHFISFLFQLIDIVHKKIRKSTKENHCCCCCCYCFCELPMNN